MALFDDELQTGTVENPEPTTSLLVTPSSGIGLGDEQAPAPVVERGQPAENPPTPVQQRLQGKKELIAQMGPLQKVLAALGEFGAGVQGRASPLDLQVEQNQRQRLLKMQEFKFAVDSMNDGLKFTQQLSGDAKTQAVQQFSAQLEGTFPGMGQVFQNLSQAPDTAELVRKYGADLPEVKLALETGGPQAVVRLFSSPEFMAKLATRLEEREIPVIFQKVRALATGWQQFVPKDKHDEYMKDGRLSIAEISEINEYAKQSLPKAALSENQLRIAMRNQESVFGTLGIPTVKTEQDIIKSKETDKGNNIEISVGDGLFQKALVRNGEVVKLIGQPYQKKDGTTVIVNPNDPGAVADKIEAREQRNKFRSNNALIQDLSGFLTGVKKTPGATGARGAISETVGGAVSQISEAGGEAVSQVVSGASIADVTAVRTRAQMLRGRLLPVLTNEDGRYTEAERAIATQALAALDVKQGKEQVLAATRAMIQIAVMDRERSRKALGVKSEHDLSTREGYVDQAKQFKSLGLNDKQAADLTDMLRDLRFSDVLR